MKPWFWLVQLVPLSLALLFGIVSVYSRRTGAETTETRTRRARRAAQAALRDANKQLESAPRDQFYAELSNGVMNYIASMLDRSPKGLTAEEAAGQLRARGRREETVSRLEQLLSRFDSIRYSPAPDTPDTRREALGEVEGVMVALDEEGKR